MSPTCDPSHDGVSAHQPLLPSIPIDSDSDEGSVDEGSVDEGSVEAGNRPILVSVGVVTSLGYRARLAATAINFLLSGIAMAAVGVTTDVPRNSGRSC
jgi:hypothetical protein